MTESTYSEGDLVEITDGEAVIRARVVLHPSTRDRCIDPLRSTEPDEWPLLSWYEIGDRTVTLIEKAAPKNVLPTEHGWYAASLFPITEGEGITGFQPYVFDGEWKEGLDGPVLTNDQLANLVPFTRLEPVPVTAKKVLDALWDNRSEVIAAKTADDIRALICGLEIVLGVTS